MWRTSQGCNAKLLCQHYIKLSLCSLSFCPDITLIQCLKVLKNQKSLIVGLKNTPPRWRSSPLPWNDETNIHKANIAIGNRVIMKLKLMGMTMIMIFIQSGVDSGHSHVVTSSPCFSWPLGLTPEHLTILLPHRCHPDIMIIIVVCLLNMYRVICHWYPPEKFDV